jgi:hypothetical protein
LMEYCNDANYFQEKIEEVSTQCSFLFAWPLLPRPH